MKLLSRVVAIAALTLGIATAAGAAPITEVEFNGTIAAAQAIPTSAFTTPVPGTVFPPGFPTATISGLGGDRTGDIDFYAFFANGGDVYFDIDDDPFTFDTVLALFSSDGTWLAFDDDTALDPSDPMLIKGDPGSPNFQDSFLGVFTLPGPGTYYIAVSEFANFPSGIFDPGLTFQELSRADGEFGGFRVMGASPGVPSYLDPVSGNGTAPYTLHISVQNPGAQTVPEPVTLLLFGAGLTATALRMRRR